MQLTIYMETPKLSRGATELGWVSCVASAGRVAISLSSKISGYFPFNSQIEWAKTKLLILFNLTKVRLCIPVPTVYWKAVWSLIFHRKDFYPIDQNTGKQRIIL